MTAKQGGPRKPPFPVGPPRTREKKSQQAQLRSVHYHGGRKDVKRNISYKTGYEDWREKERLDRLRRMSDPAWSVQEAIDQDKNLQGYGIKASMSGSKVELTGTVDTLADKEHLIGLVRQLPGVGEIDDKVAISTDGYIDDDRIAREVEQELLGDPRVDAEDIGAEVSRGTVILHGRADEPKEEQAAVRAAKKARGVRNVVSLVKTSAPGEVSTRGEASFLPEVRNDGE
ncbi:MAG: BON domain-containing protein [Clostridia bacterium]|nr:BON domain-containing protein [Clostridia bacterium]